MSNIRYLKICFFANATLGISCFNPKWRELGQWLPRGLRSNGATNAQDLLTVISHLRPVEGWNTYYVQVA